MAAYGARAHPQPGGDPLQGAVTPGSVADFMAYLNNDLEALIALGLFLGPGRQIAFTAGHMLGNCNMGLILAVLADRAPFEVIAFFALAQLPMYMLPLAAVPLYRRLI